MADDLDLDFGDPSKADKILDDTGTTTRRRRRGTSGTDKPKETTAAQKKASKIADGDLTAKLYEFFDRIVTDRRTRGDDELADAIEEEKESMTLGIVSVTRSIPFLRVPVVILVNFLQPVLAFRRVGGILIRRVLEARQSVILAQQQAEWEKQAAEAQTPAYN